MDTGGEHGLGGFCLTIAGLGLAPSFPWALFACVMSGVTNMTMVQLAAPEEMRGRITSILQLYPALISLGAFHVGPLADLIGARHIDILGELLRRHLYCHHADLAAHARHAHEPLCQNGRHRCNAPLMDFE